jgi:large subunit ribosomal protein L32
MSKKPTPKKQQAHSQSSRRYKTFQNKTRKRLVALTNVQKCPKCGEAKLSHSACEVCGFYKGKSVIDKGKEVKKITKVKA